MSRTKILVASIAATLILAAGAEADQKTVSYNVAPGACSNPISIPANNKPVIMAGTSIQPGNRHVAQATLLRANTNSPVLSWTGIDVTGAISGDNSGAGAHVIFLDFGQQVDIQTAPSLHIKVCNSGSNPIGNAFGYLTFFY